MSRHNRRDFLRHATALGTAYALPTVMPSSVFGRDKKPAPSKRITVGMIGVGRQAKYYKALPVLGAEREKYGFQAGSDLA